MEGALTRGRARVTAALCVQLASHSPSRQHHHSNAELVQVKGYCKEDFGAFEACFDAAEAGSRPEEECLPLVGHPVMGSIAAQLRYPARALCPAPRH